MSGQLPSVADLLALPEFVTGEPRVVAGAAGLARQVRWVHVSEVADIAGLLRGGELLLATGVALPSGREELERYATELAAAGAAGLVIELGRRYRELPSDLVRACARGNLPLVELRRVVKFVEVTRAAHALILDSQVDVLRRAEWMQETFTALVVGRAPSAEIVETAAAFLGTPVIVENPAHQVIVAALAGRPAERVLDSWEARSRRVSIARRTGVGGPEGWTVTSLESGGERWGRLVAVTSAEADERARADHAMILERAATALTLRRLTGESDLELKRQSHRSMLVDIINRRYGSAADVYARAAALGVSLTDAALVAVVVLTVPADDDGSAAEVTPVEVTDLVVAATRSVTPNALAGALPDGGVGVLLGNPGGGAPDALLERLARAIQARLGPRYPASIGVSPVITRLRDVAGAFRDAGHVAEAARASGITKAYYQLADVRLPGLLYLLRDDVRVQRFVERLLGRLLAHDERHQAGLLAALRAYLDRGGNKSQAAEAAGLSRQAFYHRLATAQRVLGVDLEAPANRTALHVALIALDVQRAPRR